jgi:hypothetical protein
LTNPYREPVRSTLARTVTIALVVGGVVALLSGGPKRWPLATLLVLWPSFGGHWVDLWFLNWLRPRLAVTRAVQVAARIATWFVGGVGLGFGMELTATWLARLRPEQWPAWWQIGTAFVGVEMVAHFFLQLRGRPSFYNGRG